MSLPLCLAASPWVILDGSGQASSSLSNTHGHEYSHQRWGRSWSGPRSEDTQGAAEEPIKPQDKGHWWLSCRAYFHYRPLRRDSVTQATGCLLIPDSLLHFLTSSLLHLKSSWYTSKCHMACAVEESGYGKGNFVIVTLTAKTPLKWKFSWQHCADGGFVDISESNWTIGISRRERIRPDASTTAGQGGNAFEHQHSVTCFRGAFVVSYKSKAISLQCWSLFCSQFQSEHPLSWQEPCYASLYTN